MPNNTQEILNSLLEIEDILNRFNIPLSNLYQQMDKIISLLNKTKDISKDFKTNIDDINEDISDSNTTFLKAFESGKVWGDVKHIDKIRNFTDKLAGISGSVGLIVSGFNLLKFTVSTVVDMFTQSSPEIQKSIDNINERAQVLQSRFDNLSNIKLNSDTMLGNTEADIEKVKRLVDLLRLQIDETNHTKNLDEVKILADQINSIIPGAVTVYEDGLININDELEKQCENLKRRAEIEAYSQLYTENLRVKIEAEKEYNKLVAERDEYMSSDAVKSGHIDKKYIDKLNEQINESKKIFDQSLEDAKYYESEMIFAGLDSSQALDDVMDSFVNLALQQGLSYGEMVDLAIQHGYSFNEEDKKQLEERYNSRVESYNNERGLTTILGNDMLEIMKNNNGILTKQEEEFYGNLFKMYEEHGIKMDAFETSQYELIQKKMQEKNLNLETEQGRSYAALYGMLVQQGIDIDSEEAKQYEDLLKRQQENNILLSEEETKYYVEELQNLKKQGVDINSENAQQAALLLATTKKKGVELEDAEREKFDRIIEIIASSGEKGGSEYIGKIKESIQNGSLKEDMEGLLEEANKIAGEKKIKFKGSISLDIGKFKGKIGNMESYASGGFPTPGQLFIANEPGNPELIGDIGGRTAVVNNKMILEGIEASMFNGIIKGMQEMKQHEKSTGPFITEVYLDGELMDRRIKKANDKQFLRVGKPIF